MARTCKLWRSLCEAILGRRDVFVDCFSSSLKYYDPRYRAWYNVDTESPTSNPLALLLAEDVITVVDTHDLIVRQYLPVDRTWITITPVASSCGPSGITHFSCCHWRGNIFVRTVDAVDVLLLLTGLSGTVFRWSSRRYGRPHCTRLEVQPGIQDLAPASSVTDCVCILRICCYAERSWPTLPGCHWKHNRPGGRAVARLCTGSVATWYCRMAAVTGASIVRPSI